ncbi:MAG: NUDIX domain-containing protein [Clostridium sp.]
MERWPDRGAAIIPFKNNIILMRRERGYGKNKQVYYTIPGGGKEENETMQQTTIREIYEELGINIRVKKLLYKVSTIRRMQYIFLGKYVSGKFGTGEGEEFQDVDYNKYGRYIPEIVSYEKLKTIKLVPVNLKREIINDFDYIIGKTKERKVDEVKKIIEHPRRKKIQTQAKSKNMNKGVVKLDSNKKNINNKLSKTKNKLKYNKQNKYLNTDTKVKVEKRIIDKNNQKNKQKEVKNKIIENRFKEDNIDKKTNNINLNKKETSQNMKNKNNFFYKKNKNKNKKINQ